jgi:aldose 1-epimerase
MCFTGDTLEDQGRRRRAIAVEPMSCPPDALRSGRHLVVLEPGQNWLASWGLRPR